MPRILISILIIIFLIILLSLFFLSTNTKIAMNFKNDTTISREEYQSHSLKSLKSNQWYSTLFSENKEQPIYAFPLAYKITNKGLGFSYPNVIRTQNTIFGSYSEDFTVGYKNFFSNISVVEIGDWSIRIVTKNNNESLDFTITHGIPFTAIQAKGKNLIFSFKEKVEIYENNKKQIGGSAAGDSYVFITNGNVYAVFLETPSEIFVKDKEIIIVDPVNLQVALLDTRNNYKKFKEASRVKIIGTNVEYRIKGNEIFTDYRIVSENGIPLITLLPHQYNYLETDLPFIGSYETLRGSLKLVRINTFTTRLKVSNLPDTFESIENMPEINKQISIDINDFIKEKVPTSKDYFLGIWFGKASSLILLADSQDLDDDRDKLIDYITPFFIRSLNYFNYDSSKSSLIATNPEFGNDRLNDHHFHYGYFIRMAAVLSKYDRSLIPKINSKIDQMVDDIANTDRTSDLYPYIRNFDTYEGHSWADGYGDTPDGNNQESSSEALNAWYAVYLWGKVTNNEKVSNVGSYLFATEKSSAYEYWWNNKRIYKKPYEHMIASIVWGGKVDYSTWFSGETNMKYGIQILPVTPASSYLRELTDFNDYVNDYIKSGGNIEKSWGELFTILESFYNPSKAIVNLSKVKNYYDATPKSLFMYMIYNNKKNNNKD